MRFSPRNWGTKQLLLSWCAYWLVLGAATLKPALAILARVSGAGAHGDAGLSYGDGLIKLTVHSADSGAVWTGAIHFTSLILWLFGPPLLLWLLWAVTRPRRDAARDRVPLG
jgi:hypothetical protein